MESDVHLGVDLVDVLAAWAGAADVGDGQGRHGDVAGEEVTLAVAALAVWRERRRWDCAEPVLGAGAGVQSVGGGWALRNRTERGRIYRLSDSSFGSLVKNGSRYIYIRLRACFVVI